YLNFDASADATKHFYTQVERQAIQQILQVDYSQFSFFFTQDLATAQAHAAVTGGKFVTESFNVPPPGGKSDQLDFRNLDLGGNASIDVNDFIGGAAKNQPEPTGANIINMSATIAAHELGHLVGLRHGDGYGLILATAFTGVLPDANRPTLFDIATRSPETADHIMGS